MAETLKSGERAVTSFLGCSIAYGETLVVYVRMLSSSKYLDGRHCRHRFGVREQKAKTARARVSVGKVFQKYPHLHKQKDPHM